MLEGFQQFTEFAPHDYSYGRLGLSDFKSARKGCVVRVSGAGVLQICYPTDSLSRGSYGLPSHKFRLYHQPKWVATHSWVFHPVWVTLPSR